MPSTSRYFAGVFPVFGAAGLGQGHLPVPHFPHLQPAGHVVLHCDCEPFIAGQQPVAVLPPAGQAMAVAEGAAAPAGADMAAQQPAFAAPAEDPA